MTTHDLPEINWNEDETIKEIKRGPRFNFPISDDLVGVKQPINIMGENFLKKYIVTKDLSKNAYIYNGKYWVTVAEEYLHALAMNLDTSIHTSSSRRKQTVDYALHATYKLQINWNQLAIEEIPFDDCVYNLVTNERRDHKWEDYLNTIIPHSYKKWIGEKNLFEKMCPVWLSCLNQWLETEDKILAFQEFFGYCLCSHSRFKKAMVLWGESDTGKSIPCEILKEIAGHYFTCSIRPEDMDNPLLLAPIKGKKLNLITELTTGAILAEGGFKQLVSGEPIQINPKYANVETIIPIAKHVIATNVLPEIRDDSDGVYNRLLIIKFNNVVRKEKQDKYLIDKLKSELDGIIAWSVEGAKRLTKNNGKFTEIEESVKILSEYKISQNALLYFIETSDLVERSEDGEIKTEDFRRMFQEFKGGKEFSPNYLGKALSKLGIKSISRNGKRFYKGISLKKYESKKQDSPPEGFMDWQ